MNNFENNISDKNIVSVQSVAVSVFENIEKAQFEESDKLQNTWKTILLKLDEYKAKKLNLKAEDKDFIPNDGQNIFDHSKISDIKNGILFIETDHPGWIELIKINQNFILRGFNYYLKDFGITSIVAKVGGSKANISEREKLFLKTETEEKILQQTEESRIIYEEYLRKLAELKVMKERKNFREEKNGFSEKNKTQENASDNIEKKAANKLPKNLQNVFEQMKKKTID